MGKGRGREEGVEQWQLTWCGSGLVRGVTNGVAIIYVGRVLSCPTGSGVGPIVCETTVAAASTLVAKVGGDGCADATTTGRLPSGSVARARVSHISKGIV